MTPLGIAQLVYAGVSASMSAISALWMLVHRLRGKPVVRPSLRATAGRRLLFQQIVIVSVMALTWYAGGWTLADVGASEIHPLLALMAGALSYIPLIWLTGLLYTIAGYAHLLATMPFDSLREIYPRSPRQKCMFALALALNPITEEWIFRGILVSSLYALTGSSWLLAAAIVVSVAAHSYQKPSTLPFHVAFALLACCLVLSPLGYLGAVGMHMAGDIYPLAKMRGAFHRWKAMTRAGGLRTTG